MNLKEHRTFCLVFILAWFLPASIAVCEALSTTSFGISLLRIEAKEESAKEQIGSVTSEGSSDIPQSGVAGGDSTEVDSIKGPFISQLICQRISAPTFLGLEIGAGGCMGFIDSTYAYARMITTHVQLIYYPLAARTKLEDDLGLRMKREFFGDVYISGVAGLGKITHGENDASVRSLPSDILEFGGGIGWSYRLGKNLGIGFEGLYKFGSILSKATTGSSQTLTATASLTAFL